MRNLEGKVGNKATRPKVHYSPMFTKEPDDVSDDKGAEVKLSCEADGYPDPKYIWYRNGDINRVVGVKKTLKFKLADDTAGKYYCRVSVQGYPEISVSATVYMKGPPSIQNKASQAVQISKEGETANLVCKSFAIPKPSKGSHKNMYLLSVNIISNKNYS